MQCDRYMHFPTPDYEDIDSLHKTLLHWLVVYMYVYYNIDINKHEWRFTTYIYVLDYD